MENIRAAILSRLHQSFIAQRNSSNNDYDVFCFEHTVTMSFESDVFKHFRAEHQQPRGRILSVKTTGINKTMTADEQLIYADAVLGGADLTVTLPVSGTSVGESKEGTVHTVKRISDPPLKVEVATQSSQLIDGKTGPLRLLSNGDSFDFISIGSGWRII